MITIDLMPIALVLLKATALLLLAIAVIALLRKAEPRWRALTARAAAISLPIVFLAGLVQPISILAITDQSGLELQQAEVIYLPQKGMLETSMIEPSLFPNTKPATRKPNTWLNYLGGQSTMTLSIFASLIIWIGIALILFLREIRWLFVMKKKHSAQGNHPSETLSILWKMACEEIGVPDHKVPNLIESKAENRSPFLLPGFRRNTLILPDQFGDRFDRETVLHVFRHEAAHSVSNDIYWIPAMRFLCCLKLSSEP